MTQTKLPPKNPGRFIPAFIIASTVGNTLDFDQSSSGKASHLEGASRWKQFGREVSTVRLIEALQCADVDQHYGAFLDVPERKASSRKLGPDAVHSLAARLVYTFLRRIGTSGAMPI